MAHPIFLPVINYIRNHFHPLWHLRRMSWFRRLQSLIDFPVSKRMGKIKVSVFWLRDMSQLFTPDNLEQKSNRCFEALLAGFKPNLLLDIGANIGSYSWRTLNLTDQTDVWMFEPDEKNLRLLNRTIARNKLKRATLYAAAVSDVTGELPFLIDEASGMTGSLANHLSNTWSLHYAYGMEAKRTVPSITLDSLVEKLAGKLVLIKIDVEGAEDRVLEGARQVLREIRPVILVECYNLHKITWLAEMDYVIHDLKEVANYLALPSELKEQILKEWLI